MERPVLMHTMSGSSQVWGVTVLFDKVYAVRYARSDVEEYNSTTLKFTKSLRVSGLISPWDLTSSSKCNCLYVADRNNYRIHRVGLNGNVSTWSVGDWPVGISVTHDADPHVLVTCYNDRQLKEFTADGRLVQKIVLQENVLNPLHAIKLNADQFVVSHGWDTDRLHQVCIVNAMGNVVRSYGRLPGSTSTGRLKNPRHLAVDGEGNVIVADYGNKRVLLLDEILNYVRELVSTRNGSSSLTPWRLYLDHTRGRLFVADYVNNDVLIFRVQNV